MINNGAKIGIVCCSNGLKREDSEKIRCLEDTLRFIGLRPVFSDYIYAAEDVYGGTAKERAQALMEFYQDDAIEGIFDISGGDLANGILPYLDYDVIADSAKTFWGYSDLTTVLNAVYAKTGRASVLYQIRNLIYDHGKQRVEDFRNTVIGHTNDLFNINYQFLPTDSTAGNREMHGVVVGGNIRCFLKLAGTEYMPDLKDKILLLESRSGMAAQMETYFCQLEQMGAFRKVSGILLGTFTEIQKKQSMLLVETLVRKFAGKDLPIAVTGQIGHGTDAKGIWIGKEV